MLTFWTSGFFLCENVIIFKNASYIFLIKNVQKYREEEHPYAHHLDSTTFLILLYLFCFLYWTIQSKLQKSGPLVPKSKSLTSCSRYCVHVQISPFVWEFYFLHSFLQTRLQLRAVHWIWLCLSLKSLLKIKFFEM